MYSNSNSKQSNLIVAAENAANARGLSTAEMGELIKLVTIQALKTPFKPIPLSSVIMQSKVRKYTRYVNALKEDDIVSLHRDYSEGSHCRIYKLNDKLSKDLHSRPAPLPKRKRRVAATIIKQRNESTREYLEYIKTIENPYLRKQAEYLLRLDAPTSCEEINQKYTQEVIDKWNKLNGKKCTVGSLTAAYAEFKKSLESKDFKLKMDDSGRIYSIFTALPSILRQEVTFDGERLAEATDIPCAQPTLMFLSAIENDEISKEMSDLERDFILSFCEKGNLYEILSVDTKLPLTSAKKQTIAWLNSTKIGEAKKFYPEIDASIKKNAPVFYLHHNSSRKKKTDNGKSLNSFNYRSLESEIMQGAIIYADVPCLQIHDAVYTSNSQSKYLFEKASEFAEEAGYKVNFKEPKICSNGVIDSSIGPNSNRSSRSSNSDSTPYGGVSSKTNKSIGSNKTNPYTPPHYVSKTKLGSGLVIINRKKKTIDNKNGPPDGF